MLASLSQIPDQQLAAPGFPGLFAVRKTANNCKGGIDPAAVLNKILSNGECGCRGEDGNQLRLNASANLERPVQTGLSVFSHKKGSKAQNKQ